MIRTTHKVKRGVPYIEVALHGTVIGGIVADPTTELDSFAIAAKSMYTPRPALPENCGVEAEALDFLLRQATGQFDTETLEEICDEWEPEWRVAEWDGRWFDLSRKAVA